jgi:hypothetical protein
MSGLEAIIAAMGAGGTTGTIFGGMTAAETAAAAAALEAAAGTAAAGAGAYGASAGAGAYGAGAGASGAAAGLTAEELAMLNAYGGEAGLSTGGLLGEGVEAGLGSGATYSGGIGNTIGNTYTAPTDFEKFLQFGKEGYRNVGKMYNKMPPGTSNMLTQGLLGQPQQAPQTVVRPPSGGGAPQSSNPYGNRQLPKVTPYASTALGGQDAEEMKRRLMKLLQMQG